MLIGQSRYEMRRIVEDQKSAGSVIEEKVMREAKDITPDHVFFLLDENLIRQ